MTTERLYDLLDELALGFLEGQVGADAQRRRHPGRHHRLADILASAAAVHSPTQFEKTAASVLDAITAHIFP